MELSEFDNYDPSLLGIISDDVLSKIKVGASSWEEDVPAEVVKAIKFYELFGYLKNKEPKPIVKKDDLIFEKSLDSKTDKPLILAMYLLKTGDDDCFRGIVDDDIDTRQRL